MGNSQLNGIRSCAVAIAKVSVTLTLFFQLNACSFHSNQLSALSALWSEESGPQKNWRVSWDGDIFDVYAINAPEKVIFANGEGFLLHFDGWQITSVQGILPGNEALNLDVVDNQVDQSIVLKYSGLRSKFGEQRCTRWALANGSELEADSDLIYEQRCDSGTIVTTHAVRLNSDNQLLAMRFTFHPARAPGIIRYIGD
jgi:hypothetical protein